MKIHVVEGELSYADGQTDVHDKANRRFSQAPKMFHERSNWYPHDVKCGSLGKDQLLFEVFWLWLAFSDVLVKLSLICFLFALVLLFL
jgi:hypothetical protein